MSNNSSNKDGFTPKTIIVTPMKKTTLKATRTSLDTIRQRAQDRKKRYNCNAYDAKEENEFFKMMESEIYKKIVRNDK